MLGLVLALGLVFGFVFRFLSGLALGLALELGPGWTSIWQRELVLLVGPLALEGDCNKGVREHKGQHMLPQMLYLGHYPL